MATNAGSALSKGLPELMAQVLGKLEKRDKVFNELVKTVVEQQQELAKELMILKAGHKDIPIIKVSLDEEPVWDDISGNHVDNKVVLKDDGEDLVSITPKAKEKTDNVVITVNVYKCGLCFFPWGFKTSDVNPS
jgi:hypothetical protein